MADNTVDKLKTRWFVLDPSDGLVRTSHMPIANHLGIEPTPDPASFLEWWLWEIDARLCKLEKGAHNQS